MAVVSKSPSVCRSRVGLCGTSSSVLVDGILTNLPRQNARKARAEGVYVHRAERVLDTAVSSFESVCVSSSNLSLYYPDSTALCVFLSSFMTRCPTRSFFLFSFPSFSLFRSLSRVSLGSSWNLREAWRLRRSRENRR